MAVGARNHNPLDRTLPGDDVSGLWSIGLTREVTARLADPTHFDAAVTRLSQLVEDLGCAQVTGVSPMGHVLADAVARNGPASLVSAADRTGRLALIECAVNTGVNLVRAMRDARAAGVREVVGVALVAQTVAIATWGAEGETLRAVEEI